VLRNRLVFSGIFIALVTLVTVIFVVPVASIGYFNLGDVVIMLVALVTNPLQSLIIAGIGSMLADILSGYAFYAPFTLVIKGLEGLLVAFLFRKFKNVPIMLIFLAGAVVIMLGYPLVDMWLAQSTAVFFPSLVLNGVQGFAAWCCASLASRMFLRVFKPHQ
jgi:uncharacterized membrane protein